MNTPAAVTLTQVRVDYPGLNAPALCVAALTVAPGQRTALVGPNGAGKSTLLKAVAGLIPFNGSLRVFGQPAGSQRWRVAYVPQRREVDWRFPITVRDVALMGRDAHLRWPRRLGPTDRALAEAALEAVAMSQYADRHIANLSGGQQQRVFLARALAQQADLLLLDEPFVGVDAHTETIIFATIDRLCAVGKTVLVATHDLTTLAEHFDTAVLLNRRLLAAGAPATVCQPEVLAAAYGGPLALFYPPRPVQATREIETLR